MRRPRNRGVVINMVSDDELQRGGEGRNRVLEGLVYFCDPEDLIPDHGPGLGFLDDAIYVEIGIRGLGAGIEPYEEFCEFRSAEEERRRRNGLDPHVQREEWLADKRAALHARIRKRRPKTGGGWRLRW